MKLSIIIPFYNVHEYTSELLRVLAPQITEEVEVILVDDGSENPFIANAFEWLKIIRIDHAGPSAARNAGLEAAAGDYIAFIDADDIVAKDYVFKILEEIKKDPDYIELSWRSLNPEVTSFYVRATSTTKLENPSVCTRVFKKSFIGALRFNPQKDAAEDEEFTRKLHVECGRRAYIDSYVYFYRVDRAGSTSMRFRQGLSDTKKIIYHYRHVTADMVGLLEEIKREDQKNEVFLLTMRCDIPEMANYCRIRRPAPMWANELRGEPCPCVTIREKPLRAQVVIYADMVVGADGITTWIKNFCTWFKKEYNIMILYDAFPDLALDQLRPLVRTVKNRQDRRVSCDTLLMMRINNKIPKNVTYRQAFQVVHCVNDKKMYSLPKDRKPIFVSECSKRSFGSGEAAVIKNLENPESKESLILVSTCRISGSDKGKQNERMIKLGKRLREAGIPFLWFYFSNTSLPGGSGFIRLDPVPDVRPFLRMADYLVQLSDAEAYCYSITEALREGIPVLTTPLGVINEGINFTEGKDGYIVPYDVDIDIKKIVSERKLLKPHFEDHNAKSLDQWRELIGTASYVPEAKVKTTVIKNYFDLEFDRNMQPGEKVDMWRERAQALVSMGLIKIM